MTLGLRIRGGNGQVQIDDTMPNYVVREQGAFTGSSLVLEGAVSKSPYLFTTAAFFNRHVVNFSQAITSQEAPLVFLRLNSVTFMGTFQVEGVPGNWTGFSMGLGTIQGNSQITARESAGQWFSATKVSGRSGATMGIRIRNRNSGQIIYDSGFKLVKFLQQNANFQAEGRISHNVLMYSVGWPQVDKSYFLANALTGLIGKTAKKYVQEICVCVTTEFPDKLLICTYTADSDGIAYQTYSWTALFGLIGN